MKVNRELLLVISERGAMQCNHASQPLRRRQQSMGLSLPLPPPRPPLVSRDDDADIVAAAAAANTAADFGAAEGRLCQSVRRPSHARAHVLTRRPSFSLSGERG